MRLREAHLNEFDLLNILWWLQCNQKISIGDVKFYVENLDLELEFITLNGFKFISTDKKTTYFYDRKQKKYYMTIQDLINLADGRDLSKSFPKADGFYIWDYKIREDFLTNNVVIELIPSDSNKVGFSDKVSISEIISYIEEELGDDKEISATELTIVGAEGITIAKI